MAVRKGSITIGTEVEECNNDKQGLVEYIALTGYLLSGNAPDALNFSFSFPPSIVIWYLESYSSPESTVDTVNSSLEPLSRGSGSVV